jgi:hypothetical protein
MEEQTTQTQQPAASPELNITDLQNLRSVIDVSVKRGAFSASEASAVGAVFDKLNNFLNAVAAAQQQPKE